MLAASNSSHFNDFNDFNKINIFNNLVAQVEAKILPELLESRIIEAANQKIQQKCHQETQKQTSDKTSSKIVFTNGVFDLLHRGHLSYLMQAKSLGDILIVGVNTDASVKRLNKKGDRPINTLSERLLLLAALPWIDFVVPFAENTPVELLQKIRPNIYTKGGDYTIENLPETPVMQAMNGEVIILPFVDGFSSSKIIEKIIASQT